MSEGKTGQTDQLRRGLREAGLSDEVVNAAWPAWWSEELSDDASGRTELRLALARRLGLSPRALLGERVSFVWSDEARFKHLSVEDMQHRAALASYGTSVGRSLIRAVAPAADLTGVSATELRNAILRDRPLVDLPGLLYACWAVGVPVAFLRIFPLRTKSMHAMVVAADGRHAVLLGRDASYPAPVAFTLAHEIGHIALGHLNDAVAIVDMEDPAIAGDLDDQEREADRYALELLTGSPEPEFQLDGTRFNAPGLAKAVSAASSERRIEPGTLALCLAHRTGVWPVAMSALNFIYGRAEPVWPRINTLADKQLDWSAVGDDATEWIRTVLGIRD